jgi:histidine triad (HIT) family protein
MFEEPVFKMDECIFCAIASGKLDSFKIYEDDDIVAVLDINPMTRGHTLVMPKKHFQFLFQMPDEIVSKLFGTVKMLMPLMINITKAQGVNILVNQGAVAGQNVEHLVINLIPRYPNDNIILDAQRLKLKGEEFKEVAGLLSEKIASVEAEEKKEKEKAEQEKKEKETQAQAARDKQFDEIEKIYRQVKQRMP